MKFTSKNYKNIKDSKASSVSRKIDINQSSKPKILMKNHSPHILEFQNKNKDLDIQKNKEMKDMKFDTYLIRKHLFPKSLPKKEKSKEKEEPLVVKQDWIYPLKTTNPLKLKMDQLNESIKKIPIGGGERFFDDRKSLSIHRLYSPSKMCQTSMHSNSTLEIPLSSTELRLEDKLNKIIEWLEKDNLLRRKLSEPIERLVLTDEVAGETRKKPRIWQLLQKLKRITNTEEKSFTGTENRTIQPSLNKSKYVKNKTTNNGSLRVYTRSDLVRLIFKKLIRSDTESDQVKICYVPNFYSSV